MIYTVTLNPALDYYMRLSELRADVQIADKTTVFYGGKGINVSAVLTELGIENKALGFVGGFSGDRLCALLKKKKIATDFVKIEADTRINVKIAGAKNLVINAAGPTITFKDEQALIKKLKAINDDDYIVLSGSIPSSMGNSAYERILECVNRKNAKLIVDTAGKPLFSVLKYKPFLIKPNNFELEELMEVHLNNKDDIISAAEDLQKMGAQNVLVSMGNQGMLLLDENGDINMEPIIDDQVKNTTGCGDSAVAGFIAGYLRYNDYHKALRYASACANATAFSNTLATRKEIENILNKY